MKMIGYIKMVDLEKRFGFITTSSFQDKTRRSVDVHFKLNKWQGETVNPEFAMPVVFTIDRISGRETATNIKPLLCRENHIKLALQQAAQKGRIALYDYSIGKPVWKDIVQEILERMDNGSRDMVRDSVLAIVLKAKDEERESLVEAWTKNMYVRSVLSSIFSEPCEGCDQIAIAIVRRVLGVRCVSNIRIPLSSEQREFMAYLSLDKYKHRELIVELKDGVVEELRRPDFSKIKRYKYGPKGSVLQLKDGMFPIKCNEWESLNGYAGDGYYTLEWQFTNRNPSDICEIEVVTCRGLVKISAEEIVSCLYESNMNMEAGAAEKLSNLHDTLDKQLQEAGDDVFVYELLQNANDYPNGDEDVDAEFRVLRYREGGGCLNFCHTGAAFSARNVAAICSANDQDKSDNLKTIGYKGIGFKTVFRFNDRAEVRSGAFGFAFDRKTQEKKDGVPWRTTPCWVYPKVRDGYRVDIRLVPHDVQKLEDGLGSYSEQLKNLFKDEKPLLFIPHLRCVKLYLDDWEHPIVRMAKSENWCVSKQYVENVVPAIRDNINDALKDNDHCRIPPKYRNLEKTAISFACRRNDRRLLPENENQAYLYCYLPARDAKWGFRFLMNTDMIPNGPRNDIEYSLKVNKYFARVAGGKFFEWIDSLIRSGQYEYDSVFALVPDFEKCIKGRDEKVVEFIKEFQEGFESRLPELQVPSSKGNLVPASSIVYDSTGILKKFDESVWERLGSGGDIVVKSLRDSEDFDSFVKRYKTLLKIQEFGFDDLVECVGNESFQEWLEKPITNQQFFKYLDEKGKIELFRFAKIFLDDKNKLGMPQEMYFHEDIEKYLKPFAKCFRYLPLSTSHVDMLKKEWFRSFDARELICDVLFSEDNEAMVRNGLTQIEVARLFWAFLVKYKIRSIEFKNERISRFGRRYTEIITKYEDQYSRDFLEKLPVVLERDEVASAIESKEYSIFLSRDDMEEQNLFRDRWIDSQWVRFLSTEYFGWEEGESVKKFLIEKHGNGEIEWQLVKSSDWDGIRIGIVEKFKNEILQRMLNSGSDLGFYDSIAEFYSKGCIDYLWMKNQLPVLLRSANPFSFGVSDVYLAPENVDVTAEIKSGRLSADIKILNPLLCATSEMRERWKNFGCKELRAEELLEENKRAYFHQQERYLNKKIPIDEFVGIQERFFESMSAIPLDEWKGRYRSIFNDIKNRVLIPNKDKSGLKKPSELTLGTIYNPRCAHEKFNLPLQYVYDGFEAFDAEKVKMILVELGVKEGFDESDIDFFVEYPEFCKYFWDNYVPKVSLPEDVVRKLSSSYSVFTQTGVLGVPTSLYGFDLIQKVGNLTPTSWRSHMPDISGLQEKALEQLKLLRFKTTPYFEDAIDYLLMPDSDKAIALEWISEPNSLTLQQEEKVNSYRESTDALWEDAQGNLCQVKDVVVIGAEKSVNAKALSGCPNVLKIRKLGKAEIREKALRHLGVSIISDADLKRELIKSQKQYDVKKLVLSGLLVYVTCREGEGWKEVFGKYVEELSKCFFIRCDKISLKYNDAMLLENRHFYRDEEARTAYYVGEVQGRRVFERIVESVQKWLGLRGDIEELKDFLDCDTDLAAILVEKCRGFLNDEDFMVELESRSCSLFKKVKNRISGIDGARDDKNDDKSSLISSDENLDDTGKVNDKVLLRRENQSKTVADDDNAEADESVDPMDVFCEKYNVSQIERAQFENIFRNDGLSSEQMCDANRLATMRLYNCMVNNGLHPILSEVDFVHRIGAKAVGSVPEIETKEGIRVHVASAVRGIAYISPYYWRETVAGNCAICAIGGRWADDYNCWRTEQDLKDAMDKQNDLAVIRIDGAGRAEQVSKFFQQENTIDTTHEIYALIRLRNNTKMDLAFTERATMVLGTLESAENENQEEDY